MTATRERSLRERRETIVLEHLAAKNRHDVEATIATFHSPRYEVNGESKDGESAVRDLLNDLMAGFPDFHAEGLRLHHADGAVIAEARVTATHSGPWAGIAATGRAVDYPVVAIFEFEGDRLLCKKVHFDVATILHQIGVLPGEGAPRRETAMTPTPQKPYLRGLRLTGLAALTLAGAALAACGGDDGGPTKAEFVERAGTVCQESDEKLTPIGEAIFAEAGGEPSPEQSQRFFAESAPVLREDIGRFRALEAPEGDENEVAALDDAAAEGLAEFERLAGDPEAAQAQLQEGEPDPFARFNQLVADYGIEACVSEE